MTTSKLFTRAKPFLAVIFLQFGLAGMDILSKAALNEGMSNYVFVVYRHAIATIVIAPFAIVLDRSLPTCVNVVSGCLCVCVVCVCVYYHVRACCTRKPNILIMLSTGKQGRR